MTLPAFGDPTAFVQGSGRPPLTGTALVRRQLYGVHLMLIMVRETVFRSCTDPPAYAWGRVQLDLAMTQLGGRRAG